MKRHQEVRQERLEHATKDRLARLAAMPVDTSRLERRLKATGDEAAPAERRGLALPRWMPSSTWSTWSGLAAAILLVASLFTFTIGLESPATAAPVQLARLHQAMASGQVPVATAGDAGAIRRLLTAEWRGKETLQALPEDLVPVCCLMDMGGEPVLGAMVKHEGTPVSVVVADAQEIRPSPGATVLRGGRRYVVQEAAGTTMVMTVAEGRFLCVMGSVPAGELIDLVERALAG